jgi:hypothetical protein
MKAEESLLRFLWHKTTYAASFDGASMLLFVVIKVFCGDNGTSTPKPTLNVAMA